MTDEQKEKRLAEIDERLDKLHDVYHIKLNSRMDKDMSFDEWQRSLEPEASQINKLDLEKRMLMKPEFMDEPGNGYRMSLEAFIANVKKGGFIDYDGSGNYMLGDRETNISIHPSDVKKRKIRTEFDGVMWYNR